jgi:hypothetical protein
MNMMKSINLTSFNKKKNSKFTTTSQGPGIFTQFHQIHSSTTNIEINPKKGGRVPLTVNADSIVVFYEYNARISFVETVARPIFLALNSLL